MKEPTQPPAHDSGTIDITDLVEKLRRTFVKAAKAYLMGLALAIPGLGWLATFAIKVFLGGAIDWVLNVLSKWEVMQLFFLNTAIRKASQSVDYVSAVAGVGSLPSNVSDEVYANAEQAEINAFYNFVRVTN